MLTTDQVRQQMVSLLGGVANATQITPEVLWRRLKVPKRSWLGADICLETKDRLYLVYEVETIQIPERITQAAVLAKKSDRVDVILVARDKTDANPPNPDGEDNDGPVPEISATDVGKYIAEDCLRPENGFGLLAEGSGQLHLIFPPRFTPPRQLVAAEMEAGHIPSWLRARVSDCEGLSPALLQCFAAFNRKYEEAIRRDEMRYQREVHLLRDFAEAIADVAPHFHFPLDLLETLRNWERSGVARKRDHFFHTFNNFLAGLLILGPLCRARPDTLVPETYIRCTNPRPRLRPWEILWPLVSLLHDPGYLGEEIVTMFDYGFGVRDGAVTVTEISPSDKERIKNLWKTQFAGARRDLVRLFDVVSGQWALNGSPNDLTPKFEDAMGEAYFNNTKCGHSLLSGLRVITECNTAEQVPQQNGYNPIIAKRAAVIAALSMMFHDPHTREVLDEHEIPPIAFELLPYAATLTFVDALQEDRRTITEWKFQRSCIFNDIEVKPNPVTIHATVDLQQIPIRYWTGKILEFESCLNWVNGASTAKFSIDYRTAQDLRLPVPANGSKTISHHLSSRRVAAVSRTGRPRRKTSPKNVRRSAHSPRRH